MFRELDKIMENWEMFSLKGMSIQILLYEGSTDVRIITNNCEQFNLHHSFVVADLWVSFWMIQLSFRRHDYYLREHFNTDKLDFFYVSAKITNFLITIFSHHRKSFDVDCVAYLILLFTKDTFLLLDCDILCYSDNFLIMIGC